MRVIALRDPGGTEVLHLARHQVPEPRPRQVLVRVSVIGLNQADIIMRQPELPLLVARRPSVLGMELSGEVAAVGAEVRRFSVGDRVCGLTPGGACAEFCVVAEELCWPIPEGYSDHEAAALTNGVLTISKNLDYPSRKRLSSEL